MLAAPTRGRVARSSAPMTPGEVPPALVGRMRAVLRHQAAGFVTRMDDDAEEAFVEPAQGWVQRGYLQFGEDVGDRIRRGMNGAALLAVEREPRVVTHEALGARAVLRWPTTTSPPR